jgi:hypothetical protein
MSVQHPFLQPHQSVFIWTRLKGHLDTPSFISPHIESRFLSLE